MPLSPDVLHPLSKLAGYFLVRFDGFVNGADLGYVIADWGVCPDCLGDLNDDGVVTGADLGLMISAFGPCP